MTIKTKGYKGEAIALTYFLDKGYKLLEQNYTIRGGEIDLILVCGEELVFVEVKVVDKIDVLQDYITPSKVKALMRSIDSYCYKANYEGLLRLDLVFVKNGEIFEHFENVTF